MTLLPAFRDRATDLFLRAALLAFVWGLLTGGDVSSWIIGLPVVGVATLISARLTPARGRRWSPVGTLRFAGFFLVNSFVGGLDVARRALHPRLPLAPGFVTMSLRLPPGTARVFLTNIVGLLPGTLAAGLEGDALTVHVVDTAAAVERDLRRVEERVAAMFRLTLNAAQGGDS